MLWRARPALLTRYARAFAGCSSGGCGSNAAPSPDAREAAEKAAAERVARKAMVPEELVKYLDGYIVSQTAAKKAVSTAIRARWRRRQLPQDLGAEITPKNILMVGPTGCGKTEIARRLSKVMDAPFIKVEATRFTEVGFHGRDVDSIIRDLVEVAITQQRRLAEEEMRPQILEAVDAQVVEALVGKTQGNELESWLGHLRAGRVDDRFVTVDVPEEGSSKRKKCTVKDARRRLEEAALAKKVTPEMINARAIEAVEQDGVVFIDEVDKITHPGGEGWRGRDASAEGVQRDLLPIIEGSEVTTKFGAVKTDHILFICSGAFHAVKPSDLLAEFQGRLPVRVQLEALSEKDFERILREPKNSIIKQSQALLETEGVTLTFTEDAIARIAQISWELNLHVENIGARRLQAVFEKLLEKISFDCPDMDKGAEVVIDVPMVDEMLKPMFEATDLQKHII